MDKDTVLQRITGLELEIQKIEDIIKEKQREKRLVETWRSFQKNRNGQQQKGSVRNRADYEYEFDLLQRLTNVEFTHTDIEILGQGKFWITKLFSIEGRCMEEEFKLQLEIKEIMNEDSSVTSEIIGVSVEYLSVRHKEFLKHVHMLKEENNVQTFFLLLRSYTKWSRLRQDTFEHFLRTYPDIVSQVNDNRLQLQHCRKDCVLQVDWTIAISSSHICYPEIKLSVQMKAVSQNNDVLTQAPDKFQLMLKELGIEKSINSLVSLCSE